MIALDASAILAVLMDEPGADVAVATMRGGAVSAVNLCEVMTRSIDAGGSPERAAALLRRLDATIHGFDARQAEIAAGLRPLTRILGLSLGDRACLALAQSKGLPAMTADRAWAELDIGVEIRLIR